MNITRSLMTLAISSVVLANHASASTDLFDTNPNLFTVSVDSAPETPSLSFGNNVGSINNDTVSFDSNLPLSSGEPVNSNTPNTTEDFSFGTPVTSSNDDDDDRRGGGSGNNRTPQVDADGCLIGFGCDIQDLADPEYENHEDAITEARRVADRECSSSCSDADRAILINEVYFDELHQSGSTLPTGPMASMAYFTDDNTGTNTSNNTPNNIKTMEKIDKGVRNGTYGVTMPGQFPSIAPTLYADLSPTQRLGVDNAAIILNADDLLDAEFGAGGAGGMSAPYGGAGGTIVFGNGLDQALVKHESNHAGERAIFNIIEDTKDQDYPTEEDRDTAYAASNIMYNYLVLGSDTVAENECPSCSLTGDDEFGRNTYHEARAYLSEGNNLSVYQSSLVADGVSATDANRIANELISSSVIREQRQVMNEAAEIITNLGF